MANRYATMVAGLRGESGKGERGKRGKSETRVEMTWRRPTNVHALRLASPWNAAHSPGISSQVPLPVLQVAIQ
jgi:hypothetical protein